jgi:hypothetical protein
MRTTILLVLISIVPALPPGTRGPMFAPALSLQDGRGSGTAILAALNEDGTVDILTRHLLGRRVVAMLGVRGGTYRAGEILAFDYEPGDIEVADINADGHVDLAVTPNRRDAVDVLLGDGRGRFVRVTGSPFVVSEYSSDLNKRTLHLVDPNEDGRIDALTANGRRQNTLGLLLGDGRGHFTRAPGAELESGRDRYWYALGDLNGDGHLDVTTASGAAGGENAPGRLLVKIGNGRGGFTPAADAAPLDGSAGVVALADLDDDKRLDVAVAHSDGRISILLNRGAGRFVQAPGGPLGPHARAHALLLRDVNGDGRPDVITATGEAVAVLLASGSGYQPAPGSPYRAGPGAYNVSVGDLNHDGKPDLTATSFEGTALTLLHQR